MFCRNWWISTKSGRSSGSLLQHCLMRLNISFVHICNNWIGEHQSSPNSLILNCLFRVSQLRNPSTCSVEIGGFPQRVAVLQALYSNIAWWGQTFLLCTGACLVDLESNGSHQSETNALNCRLFAHQSGQPKETPGSS